MKDRLLQISEDLDSTEELIKIVREAGFRFRLQWFRKNVQLSFLSLRMGWKSAVDIQVSITHHPCDS